MGCQIVLYCWLVDSVGLTFNATNFRPTNIFFQISMQSIFQSFIRRENCFCWRIYDNLTKVLLFSTIWPLHFLFSSPPASFISFLHYTIRFFCHSLNASLFKRVSPSVGLLVFLRKRKSLYQPDTILPIKTSLVKIMFTCTQFLNYS